MSTLLHHLSATGWGWVAVFALLDASALACAAMALTTSKKAIAIRTTAISGVAMFAAGGVTFLAQVAGLAQAFAAVEDSDSSSKAKGMAEGMSTAMNATALGIVSGILTLVATIVCVVRLLMLRSRSGSAKPAGQ